MGPYREKYATLTRYPFKAINAKAKKRNQQCLRNKIWIKSSSNSNHFNFTQCNKYLKKVAQ